MSDVRMPEDAKKTLKYYIVPAVITVAVQILIFLMMTSHTAGQEQADITALGKRVDEHISIANEKIAEVGIMEQKLSNNEARINSLEKQYDRIEAKLDKALARKK